MIVAREIFPDPLLADDDGLLCYGGTLSNEMLLEAYGNGIFPWPQEGMPLLWFSPKERGVLDFCDLHWSRRFLQEERATAGEFSVTFNQAFADVIEACAKSPRAHETGTWILPAMKKAYLAFHRAGYAHSVECWQLNGTSGARELVGGLYGVYVGGVFSGESMFFRVSNASKRCLHTLASELGKNGVDWIDIQMVTPVLEGVGGKYISRVDYLARVQAAQPRDLPFLTQR